MKTIEQRKKDFYQELIPFVGMYPKEMLREFFEYWTEINPRGRKMLFEKKRTKGVFQVSGRLRTWHRNSKQWKKTREIQVNLTPVERFKLENGIS